MPQATPQAPQLVTVSTLVQTPEQDCWLSAHDESSGVESSPDPASPHATEMNSVAASAIVGVSLNMFQDARVERIDHRIVIG